MVSEYLRTGGNFLPVHSPSRAHWTLLVVSTRLKKIFCYDSKKRSNVVESPEVGRMVSWINEGGQSVSYISLWAGENAACPQQEKNLTVVSLFAKLHVCFSWGKVWDL